MELCHFSQVFIDLNLKDKWSKCDGEVELFSDISLLTLDSVLKCAMSYDSNCQLQKLTSRFVGSDVYFCKEKIITQTHIGYELLDSERGADHRL